MWPGGDCVRSSILIIDLAERTFITLAFAATATAALDAAPTSKMLRAAAQLARRSTGLLGARAPHGIAHARGTFSATRPAAAAGLNVHREAAYNTEDTPFDFTDKNYAEIKTILAKYPKNYKRRR